MSKSGDAFRTISEVASELGLATHVLRFWESKFPQIKPLKRAGGRRYYRPQDIAILKRLQVLLHDEGYTIKGAQKLFRDEGTRAVMDMASDQQDDLSVESNDPHFISPVEPKAPVLKSDEYLQEKIMEEEAEKHSQGSLFDAPRQQQANLFGNTDATPTPIFLNEESTIKPQGDDFEPPISFAVDGSVTPSAEQDIITSTKSIPLSDMNEDDQTVIATATDHIDEEVEEIQTNAYDEYDGITLNEPENVDTYDDNIFAISEPPEPENFVEPSSTQFVAPVIYRELSSLQKQLLREALQDLKDIQSDLELFAS